MSEEDNTLTEMDSNDVGPSSTESLQLQSSADGREPLNLLNSGANEGSSSSKSQLGRKSIYSEGISDTDGNDECSKLITDLDLHPFHFTYAVYSSNFMGMELFFYYILMVLK